MSLQSYGDNTYKIRQWILREPMNVVDGDGAILSTLDKGTSMMALDEKGRDLMEPGSLVFYSRPRFGFIDSANCGLASLAVEELGHAADIMAAMAKQDIQVLRIEAGPDGHLRASVGDPVHNPRTDTIQWQKRWQEGSGWHRIKWTLKALSANEGVFRGSATASEELTHE